MLQKPISTISSIEQSSRLWTMMSAVNTNLKKIRVRQSTLLKNLKQHTKDNLKKEFLQEKVLFISKMVLFMVEISEMVKLMDEVSISSKTEAIMKGNSRIRCSMEEG